MFSAAATVDGWGDESWGIFQCRQKSESSGMSLSRTHVDRWVFLFSIWLILLLGALIASSAGPLLGLQTIFRWFQIANNVNFMKLPKWSKMLIASIDNACRRKLTRIWNAKLLLLYRLATVVTDRYVLLILFESKKRFWFTYGKFFTSVLLLQKTPSSGGFDTKTLSPVQSCQKKQN